MSKRVIETVIHICTAPNDLFSLEYDDLTEEWKNYIENTNGLRCDGGGTPGHWCTKGRGDVTFHDSCCRWYSQEVKDE